MKIFSTEGKVNFVDDNNRFVGFDTYQSCCECWGWAILDTIPLGEGISELKSQDTKVIELVDTFSRFQFDPNFFQQVKNPEDNCETEEAAVFKLIHLDTQQEKFLVLWNIHNGYYGHGFESGIMDTIERQGCL